MSKHKPLFKQLNRAFLAVLLATSLLSCVDDKYDLSKDLNTDMAVGGEFLALPIGTTDTIFLNKLIGIEEGGILQTSADGSYTLSVSDKLDVTIPKIKPLTFSAQHISLSEVSIDLDNVIPDIKRSREPLTDQKLYASISSTNNLVINENVPKEINSIKSTLFTNSPNAQITIALTGTKDAISKVDLINFKITLPEFFVLSNATDPKIPNQIIINDSFDPTSSYQITLEISSFNFAENLISNGSLNISTPVSINGTLGVELGELTVPPTDLILSPSISISTMNVGIVEGVINPIYIIDDQFIEFDQLPDFLNGSGVVLDVNPRITIEVGNSVGIPIDIGVHINPMLNGSVIASGVNDITIPVQKAITSGVQKWSKFWISNSNVGIPELFKYIQAPNMGNLVKQIPDRIDINMNANPDITQNYVIDLSIPEYSMNVAYNVDIPLSFGPDLNIVYNDTIQDLSENIGDYTDKVKNIEMVIDIKNAVPMDMKLSAKPLDIHGKAIEGVKINTAGRVLAGKIGGEVNSSLSLNIQETAVGQLKKLDAIVLEVTATNTTAVQNIQLSEKQFMLLGVKLRVPGGISINN